MDVKEIYSAIRPLRNRIHINNAIEFIMKGLLATGAICFVVACAGLLRPIPFLTLLIFRIYLCGLLLFLSAALFFRPGNLKTLRTADSLGLKEKLITCHELRDRNDPVSRIQRYDALKTAQKADFKTLYVLKVPRGKGVVLAAILLCTAAALNIPAGPRAEAAKTEAVVTEIREQAEKLEKEKKELDKNKSLSEKKLDEINRKLDEMLNDLKKAGSEEEALKALLKARNELEELKNKSLSEELARLGDNLMQNPVAKELGEALKKGDSTDIKQKLERFADSLKNLDEAQSKELSDVLKKVSEGVSGNSELAQGLNELSKTAASGSSGSTGGSMSDLMEMLSEMAEGEGGSEDSGQTAENETISRMIGSISDAKSRISGMSGKSPGKAQASAQAGNGSDREGSGQGTESSGSKGQQSGRQVGSGQPGMGSSGAGDGTSGRDLGYSGEESGTGGRAPGEKKVRDYESIYVPERLGGDGEQYQVKGLKGDAGQSSISQSGNAPVAKGGMIPYNSVLGSYKSEAMANLQDSGIPPVMRDMVREYFTSLE